jgi:hypothetical protein
MRNAVLTCASTLLSPLYRTTFDVAQAIASCLDWAAGQVEIQPCDADLKYSHVMPKRITHIWQYGLTSLCLFLCLVACMGELIGEGFAVCLTPVLCRCGHVGAPALMYNLISFCHMCSCICKRPLLGMLLSLCYMLVSLFCHLCSRRDSGHSQRYCNRIMLLCMRCRHMCLLLISRKLVQAGCGPAHRKAFAARDHSAADYSTPVHETPIDPERGLSSSITLHAPFNQEWATPFGSQ